MTNESVEVNFKKKVVTACAFRNISKSSLIESFTSKISFDSKINLRLKLSSFVRMCNVLSIDCAYFLCEAVSIDSISKHSSNENKLRQDVLIFFDEEYNSKTNKDSSVSPVSFNGTSTLESLVSVAYSKPFIVNEEREFLSPDEVFMMVFCNSKRQ